MNYDLIIVGGAMAGATLALAISAKTGGKINIALLEKQEPTKHRLSGFDARSIALCDGSCQKLDHIFLPDGKTLWQALQPVATPIRQIHVSDKGHSGIVEFHAQELALIQLGAVIGLEQSGTTILQALRQYPNIDYLCPVEIENIEYTEQYVKIALKNDRTLYAPLIVGADGNKSQVAHAAGIDTQIIREYRQSALITNILPQQAHQYRAFERFTDEGPLALLPIQDNLMSLVWCTQHADQMMQLDERDFLDRLQQRFGWRLGKLQKCGQRVTYPLTLSRAERHSARRTVLIGNAAQTLHPVAGQGFNLGMRDVDTLANILSEAYIRRCDLGSDELTAQYANRRLQDQDKTIKLTDGLLSVFANNLLALQIGRNIGLATLAQSSVLRRCFAKPTLGWI